MMFSIIYKEITEILITHFFVEIFHEYSLIKSPVNPNYRHKTQENLFHIASSYSCGLYI